MLGDVTAAVRVVASDDSVLEVTPEVLSALRLKHPAAPLNVENIVIPPDTEELITVSFSKVAGTIVFADESGTEVTDSKNLLTRYLSVR